MPHLLSKISPWGHLLVTVTNLTDKNFLLTLLAGWHHWLTAIEKSFTLAKAISCLMTQVYRSIGLSL